MEVTRLTDAEGVKVVSGVQNTNLAEGDHMNVLQFEIEAGASVPEHDHPHEQVGYIVAGRATFVTADEVETLEPGDAYAIPGGEPHSLENRGDEPVVGVDVFSPPRDFAPFADEYRVTRRQTSDVASSAGDRRDDIILKTN